MVTSRSNILATSRSSLSVTSPCNLHRPGYICRAGPLVGTSCHRNGPDWLENWGNFISYIPHVLQSSRRRRHAHPRPTLLRQQATKPPNDARSPTRAPCVKFSSEIEPPAAAADRWPRRLLPHRPEQLKAPRFACAGLIRQSGDDSAVVSQTVCPCVLSTKAWPHQCA